MEPFDPNNSERNIPPQKPPANEITQNLALPPGQKDWTNAGIPIGPFRPMSDQRTVPFPNLPTLPPQPQPPAWMHWIVRPRFSVPYILVILALLAINWSYVYVRLHSCSLTSDQTITVNGSTAFAPLVQDIANAYQHACPGANISVNPSRLSHRSLNGLAQVEQGIIDIGTSDAFADPYQNPNLTDYQVAVSVFALVANKTVDITNLSTSQLRKIYSGDITNWQEVGSRQNLDIVLVSRPATSDIRHTFETYVLGTIETVSGPQSLVSDDSATVAQMVKNQPGAVGYVSLYYAYKYGLNILSIDGKSPQNTTLVKNNVYPFWDIEHMYTRGVPSSPVQDFITNMFGADAEKILHQDGCLSVTEFSTAVLFKHISQI